MQPQANFHRLKWSIMNSTAHIEVTFTLGNFCSRRWIFGIDLNPMVNPKGLFHIHIWNISSCVGSFWNGSILLTKICHFILLIAYLFTILLYFIFIYIIFLAWNNAILHKYSQTILISNRFAPNKVSNNLLSHDSSQSLTNERYFGAMWMECVRRASCLYACVAETLHELRHSP